MNSDDTDVTFLYKFIPGVASKSYGNNVAAAAGLPPSLISRAKEKSEEFEQRCIQAMGNTSDSTHARRHFSNRCREGALKLTSVHLCLCVFSRARLSAAFPAQQSTSALTLPPTTSREITEAIKAGDFKRVLALKNAYKIAQLEFKQAKASAQSMPTA